MIALEYLQEFIYYTYMFYTALLKRDTFKDDRMSWPLVSDLTRYHIIIAAMILAMQLTALNKWLTSCTHCSPCDVPLLYP